MRIRVFHPFLISIFKIGVSKNYYDPYVVFNKINNSCCNVLNPCSCLTLMVVAIFVLYSGSSQQQASSAAADSSSISVSVEKEADSFSASSFSVEPTSSSSSSSKTVTTETKFNFDPEPSLPHLSALMSGGKPEERPQDFPQLGGNSGIPDLTALRVDESRLGFG